MISVLYFQSYSIERMTAPILSTTEDSLRSCQHFLYEMSCHYSSRHSTTLYGVLSRKILSKVHELIVIWSYIWLNGATIVEFHANKIHFFSS